ncbi:MAG: serine protease, partial [Oscillospiraceae bacterium]|nr:serine protease [Oscillospiraceae bacterium]
MKKCISILLCICIICGFSGCSHNVSSLQLAKAGSPALTFENDEVTDLSEQIIGFSAEIFRHTAGRENSLISPVSLLYALSMTANGADGQTLADFQQLAGTDIETLNRYLATFKNSLPQTAKAKLNMANAIWFRDSFNANQQFLDKNRDYYGAGIYKAPFDSTTVEDINNFAKENTGGQIDRILENIPAETVMYLINALSFDSKWEDKYKKSQIHDGIFTAYNGGSQTVK